MHTDTLTDIDRLEADLWEAADNLRANSKLTSSDYFMPVLGVIFLRHAANRFEAARRQISEDQESGKMRKRPVRPYDYIRRRALWLPEAARYDRIMEQASARGKLPALVAKAMKAIEESFEPLQEVLPRKDFAIFRDDPKVLEDLMRTFNNERVQRATGDVFGRIYEYFLAKFSIQKAHDNGEFFTPPSLVQMIVNVIEPNHGTVFDPACGSGGMFVQSSHFIEGEGEDTARKVVFYGQEKNPTTVRIAKMNLAVHGLAGKIANAITYYEDPYELAGKCDFVMANPPFNVDLVRANKVEGDVRLPFGLPGVNEAKKVSNGNYLWISYFWSYLNEQGRAGFVMSSQASSAGRRDKEVRRKIVESGDVDVMISIGSNFFYTRPVPCELWYFDRGKPPERRDKVLMIDARNVYRKVSRKINELSPEQVQNVTAIVWLYRGQRERFLALVKRYLGRVCEESAAITPAIARFQTGLLVLRSRFDALADAVADKHELDAEQKRNVAEANDQLGAAALLFERNAKKLLACLCEFGKHHAHRLPDDNHAQHACRKVFAPLGEALCGLIRQVDLLYKLATRVAHLGVPLAADPRISAVYDQRATARTLKQFDADRKAAVEQLQKPLYFHRQIVWLQDRFPSAELTPVAGLVKLCDRHEIQATDWSLSPARYVGVAPSEEDEEFEFEQRLRSIHAELTSLNKEAVELAAQIQQNFAELGA